MIDPKSWLRVLQQDREREMIAAERANLLRGPGARSEAAGAHRTPTRPLAGPLGRTVGRTLVRVGLWLMVAD